MEDKIFKSVSCNTNSIMNIFTTKEWVPSNENKEKYAQYYTSKNIAEYMASMFNEPKKEVIRIVDAGCGVGILTAAFLQRLLTIKNIKVKKVIVLMYEIDNKVIEKLDSNMQLISKMCKNRGIEIKYKIENQNFITSFTDLNDLNKRKKYDYAIMNPPYMKLNADSLDDIKLKQLGINVPNYYAAFVSLAKRLLIDKGELVAITPRSFCNGAYFVNFRQDLLNDMIFNKIHLFESRSEVFNEEDILQENIIYHCIKKTPKRRYKISIIHSYNDSLKDMSINKVFNDEIIFPNDDSLIIRIVKDDRDKEIIRKMQSLPCKLIDLNISVSTGPVVDFRQDKNKLQKSFMNNSIPYFFSEHLSLEGIEWPKKNVKKYNFIVCDKDNKSIMRNRGNYVLVRRMSSKEDKKRIVSCLCNSNKYKYNYYAFDNKINYYHNHKSGLPLIIAKGLNVFLNSSIVDRYFRIFSGNTQVNVTDLKSLNYPTETQLHLLGERYDKIYYNQDLIDKTIEEILFLK